MVKVHAATVNRADCANLTAGSFAPLIDRTYAPENIAGAFRFVMSGAKVGNVVIKIIEE